MSAPSLLDHPPIQRALTDPSTSYWLRDLLGSAASRDPVDTLADLDAARALVAAYVRLLLTPNPASSARKNPVDDRPPGKLSPRFD
jgi:hypothetical protein